MVDALTVGETGRREDVERKRWGGNKVWTMTRSQFNEKKGKKEEIKINEQKSRLYTFWPVTSERALLLVTFLLTAYTRSSVQKWQIWACAQGIEP